MTLAARCFPLLLLALLAPAPLASAEAPNTPAGPWKFETAKINLTCKLSGEMEIARTDKAGLYSCRFVAVQSCAGDPPLEFHVEQTCVATRSGARVTITSKIEKVIGVKPAGMRTTVESGYAPDNFELRLNAAGSEMNGMFHSLNQAVVKFWRPASDLVS